MTLPFLGLWLASAGIGLTLVVRRKDDGAARSTWGVALAVATVIAATGLSRSLQPDEPSLAQRIQLLHIQRQFMDALGTAICDLGVLHRNGPAVRWVPRYDITECRVCQDIIGPLQFLHDLGFGSLVRIAAHRSCPAANLKGVWPADPAAVSAAVTEGTESGAAMFFVRKYLAPLAGSSSVPVSESGKPSVVSVTPSSGAGRSQTLLPTCPTMSCAKML